MDVDFWVREIQKTDLLAFWRKSPSNLHTNIVHIFFRSALFHLPNIYLKPVLESEFTEEEENRRKTLYPCPIFMNKVSTLKALDLKK